MKLAVIILAVISGIIWWMMFDTLFPGQMRFTPKPRYLTSQWHREEEARIDKALAELRKEGKWNEHFDKFTVLGDYGWKDNMDCGDGTKPMPCMSGGYTFSREAFEQLKAGILGHDAHNSIQESFRMSERVTRLELATSSLARLRPVEEIVTPALSRHSFSVNSTKGATCH